MDYEPNYDRAVAERNERAPGALDQLDRELERLEKDLAVLETRLGPMLNLHDLATTLEPRLEPSSQFRARIERLSQLRSALNDIIARVDL